MEITVQGPPVVMAFGHEGLRFDGVTQRDVIAHRWIGKCRTCRAARKLEGYKAEGTRRGVKSCAVVDLEGRCYTTRILNVHDLVVVNCCAPDVFVMLRIVHDSGAADSKRHTCGARCTNATGPACDCKCRGANHGSGATC